MPGFPGPSARERSLRRTAIQLAVVFLLVTGASARAQQDPFARGFDAVPLKATPAQKSGGIDVEGASPEYTDSFRAALLFDYTHGVLALRLGDEKLGNPLPYRLD